MGTVAGAGREVAILRYAEETGGTDFGVMENSLAMRTSFSDAGRVGCKVGWRLGFGTSGLGVSKIGL